MKIISQSGGGVDVIRLKMTGLMRDTFANTMENGAAIWAALNAPVPTYDWQDSVGEFKWLETATSRSTFLWREE